MKKAIETSVYWVGILSLGIIIGVTIKLASAWVEPDQMPPGGNIAAPINTSNIGQSKIGGMIIALGDVINGLIVKNGKSGFGLDTPTERVDVNGNIKLNGRIIGLQAPTDANDAVNKGYVDALGSGGNICFTYYCGDPSIAYGGANDGGQLCTDSGGTQKHCPPSFSEKIDLGKWGACSASWYGEGYSYFSPPGGGCFVSGGWGYEPIGKAYLCCQ